MLTPEFIAQQFLELPTFPAAISQVLLQLEDPETPIASLAATVAAEPKLTVQLLRLANSPFFGVPRHVGSIEQAVVLLGRGRLRTLALGALVKDLHQHMDGGPLDSARFWQHSLSVACAAQALAEQDGSVPPLEAFTAGLLHDIGKVGLALCRPTAYANILATTRQRGVPLDTGELDALGTTHAAIGAVLCRRWQLPDTIAEAIDSHHQTPSASPLTQLLHQSNLLVHLLGYGGSGNQALPFNHLARLSAERSTSLDVSSFAATLHPLVEEAHALMFDQPGTGPSAEHTEDEVSISVASRTFFWLLRVAVLGLGFQAVPRPTDRTVLLLGGGQPSLPAGPFPHLDIRRWLTPGTGFRVHAFRAWLHQALAAPTAP